MFLTHVDSIRILNGHWAAAHKANKKPMPLVRFVHGGTRRMVFQSSTAWQAYTGFTGTDGEYVCALPLLAIAGATRRAKMVLSSPVAYTFPI